MANQPNSLGYNLETLIEQLLRNDGVIPSGFQILHESESSRASKNRIILSATVGDQDWGGSRPWNVAIEIDLSVVLTGTPEEQAAQESEYESYVASIEDVMANSWATVAASSLFEDVLPLPAEAEQKSAQENTRHRVRTYNVLAVESEAAFTYLRPDGTSIYHRPDGSSQYLRPAT